MTNSSLIKQKPNIYNGIINIGMKQIHQHYCYILHGSRWLKQEFLLLVQKFPALMRFDLLLIQNSGINKSSIHRSKYTCLYFMECTICSVSSFDILNTFHYFMKGVALKKIQFIHRSYSSFMTAYQLILTQSYTLIIMTLLFVD